MEPRLAAPNPVPIVPARIVVVSSPGRHFCADTDTALTEIAADWAVVAGIVGGRLYHVLSSPDASGRAAHRSGRCICGKAG